MKLKKKVHIHALDFVNTYVNERPVLLILDFFRVIEEQEETELG